MRLVGGRYVTNATPAIVKKARSQLVHVSPPSKGMSFFAATNTVDAQFAGVLINFYVEDDRITARSGYTKVATMTGGAPVYHLIPYYGAPEKLVAGTNMTLCDATTGSVLKSGFTSDDWHWTSFSNLGEDEWTVMVNGADGVWSWNGGVTGADFVKEAITAPMGAAAWLDIDDFHVVLAHQNRLWFADQANLAVYYLPIQQKTGEVGVLPMTAIFKRGGTIRCLATWTTDGGMGMDDMLVVFTDNGECAIYSGVDPESDMSLVGVYRFDPPMSKHSVINYGGDLYILLPTGVIPMTALIKAGKDGTEAVDRSVVQEFMAHSVAHREQFGWQLFLNPSSGRLFCNLPMGGGSYHQMIRHMPKAVWSKFQDIPAKCWGWIDPYVFFGDDAGNVYAMHPQYQTDNGQPIRVDVMMAWSQYNTPALKQFKMILPYIISDGHPRPYVDVKVDYDMSAATNWPELSVADDSSATWDEAEWDVASWVGGSRTWSNWTGVGALGRVGAVRLSAQVSNCSFAVTGFDILYEQGSVFG